MAQLDLVLTTYFKSREVKENHPPVLERQNLNSLIILLIRPRKILLCTQWASQNNIPSLVPQSQYRGKKKIMVERRGVDRYD